MVGGPAAASEAGVALIGPGRDFGYFPGDIIRIEAVIDAPAGTVLDKNSIPAPGPLNGAVELRRIAAHSSATPTGTRIVIDAEYQNFFAADHVMQTEIPGYTLRLAEAGGNAVVKVPAWSYHVSPLRIAERVSAELPGLRPDEKQPELPEAPYVLRAGAALIAALLLLAALAFRRRWIGGFAATSAPFAAACTEIGRLRKMQAPAEASFKALHRAFDATAGRRILAGDLAHFTAAHPRFAALHSRASAFFDASHAMFFSPEATPSWRHDELWHLARLFRAAERRR